METVNATQPQQGTEGQVIKQKRHETGGGGAGGAKGGARRSGLGVVTNNAIIVATPAVATQTESPVSSFFLHFFLLGYSEKNQNDSLNRMSCQWRRSWPSGKRTKR